MSTSDKASPLRSCSGRQKGWNEKNCRNENFSLQLFGAVAKGAEGQIFAEDVQHLKAGGAIVLKSAVKTAYLKPDEYTWLHED